MKVKTLSALAGLGGALIMSCEANANYVGLATQLQTTVTVSGVSRSVWRVYAVFSNAQDYVTAIAGSPQTGILTIENRNSNDTALGTGFVNPGAAGNFAPSASSIKKLPNTQWDTFATIGVAINDGSDQTAGSPGFPTFINGTSLVNNNISWFVPGPVEQGRAGGPNSHAISTGPVTGLGVLIAQLTVNAGQNVRGTVSVSGVNAGDGAAAFTSNGQTFNSFPAPGALALLGLAGVVGSRRRRA